MTERVVVCAFDLATTLGWALHEPGLERPFWGSERLPGGPGDVGAAADRLERLMRELRLMYGVTHWFFEAQHIGTFRKKGETKARMMNMDVMRRLIALGTIVEKFAFQTKTHAYQVIISEWRKHFIGRGAAFGDVDPKELAVQKCRNYGWHTDIADEAEALGILDFALTMIPDYVRPWRDEALFKGRDFI